MTDDVGSETGRRRPMWAALLVAAALIVVAVLIVVDMQRLTTAGRYDRIGPTTVPYLVAGGLAILAVLTALEAWRNGGPHVEPIDFPPMLILAGGLVAQIVLLPIAGFTVGTGVLFATTALAFGERRVWLSLPFGLLLAGGVWFVFARLLRLTLPQGPPELFVIDLLRGAGMA